ncbi:MAG: S1 RNA-binding domain-containing protein, partial [Chloroflexia bacterium]|nr:S1 RNA-binding domain-containing protein [Chloroflexia bacterium]
MAETITESLIKAGELPSMEQLLEEDTYCPLERGEIRLGEIIDILPRFIVMDVNAKREGFVPKRDLDRLEEQVQERIEVGAEFPVYVLRREDSEGRTIVSISRGLIQEDWDRARTILESKEIWEGTVIDRNRGGLLVQFGRIRGFVPASHIVEMPRGLPPDKKKERLEDWIGQNLGLRVIEVDQRRNRLVLSERVAHKKWREKQLLRLLDELEEGQLVQGRVSNIVNFGAFVNLGGADGLIHISEMAWERVADPHDVLDVDQEVEVKVIRLDRDRKRIALSLRQAQKDPWERIEERYTLGQLVTAQVTRIVNFGAFAKLEPGVEGLVHISELAEDRIWQVEEVVEEGEILPLRIVRIDPVRRRLGLSLRRVTADEWQHWRDNRIHIDLAQSEESPEAAIETPAAEQPEDPEAAIETPAAEQPEDPEAAIETPAAEQPEDPEA